MTVARDIAPEVVLHLPPRPGNPRNSEGSFIALRDGRILYVYSHFTGGAHDDAEAFLAGRFSEDGGRTWSTEDVTVVRNPPGRNIMSVSLLRLHDGRIVLFYILKESRSNWRILMRVSTDEARTWSEPRQCTPTPGLYVLNNDRAVQLRSGRLVLPIAYRTPEQGRSTPEALIACLLSDDGGATWRRSREGRRVAGVWTQEPGVVELKDGRLLLFCRTQVGCQYISHSTDGGETWEELRPSNIVSPLSPASLKRIPHTGDILLVWNNNAAPWSGWETLRRSPLNVAISRDEGQTWENIRTIADDPTRWYCYTAIAFVGAYVLLAHSAGSGKGAERLAFHQITRFHLDWLQQ